MPGSRVKHFQQSVDLLAVHRLNPGRYPFLLESAGGSGHERHDILFAFPSGTLTLDDSGLHSDAFSVAGTDFLDNLQRWYGAHRLDATGELPFNGGWFLFLGYYLRTTFEALSHAIELSLAYFPLGFCLALAASSRSRALVTALALTLVIAAPIEYLQGWVVGRYPDVSDVCLSLLGAWAGCQLAAGSRVETES